jgi:hypothetical protein
MSDQQVERIAPEHTGVEDCRRVSDEEIAKMAVDAARAAALVFAANGWTYGRGVERFTPSEAHLRNTIHRLLVNARAGGRDTSVGTGRFNVHRFIQDGEEVLQVDLGLSDSDEEVVRNVRP